MRSRHDDAGESRLTEFSETGATERYSMSVVSRAPVLLQGAIPSLECGSQSQGLSVYHEGRRQRRRHVAPTAGPGDASCACPRPSNPLMDGCNGRDRSGAAGRRRLLKKE